MHSCWQRLVQYWRLMRGHQPVGFVLLLAPVLWSLWLAAMGIPSLELLIVFVLATWVMRAMGCVINDIADRNIDPLVKRTRTRPLATRAIGVPEALILCASLGLFALVLVLQTNALTIALAPIALLLAGIYPFSKRWFPAPQLFLALSFSCAIPMSFSAVLNQLPPALWWLWISNVLWVLSYDTFYAMADRADDQNIAMHSTALLLGSRDLAFIATAQAMLVVALSVCAYYFSLGPYFYLALLVTVALFVYQHMLAQTRTPKGCLGAFNLNAWTGMVLFAGIALHFQSPQIHQYLAAARMLST